VRAVEIALDAWGDCVKLVLLGDLHLGHSQTDEKLIAATAERLTAPDTYWLDLGDSIDAINMRDPRFDPRSLPDWVELADLVDLTRAQVDRYRHYFGKLGSTCWARLYGNHEYAVQRHTERDVYEELNAACGLDGKRALGYSGFVRVRFRQMQGVKVANTWTQTIYLSHGSGGGKLAGAKAGGVERLAMAYDADIYAQGHTHTKLVLQKRALGLSPRTLEVIDKPQIMVNVGSFLDGKEGYPEHKGLYPQALGPVELHFIPATKTIRIVQ
jgi:hypothetical protein